MNKRIAGVLVCLLSVFLYARGEVYTVETLPSPKDKGQEFFVSNPDTVISFETEARLNDMLRKLEKETEVEMAVVVVKDFNSGYYTTHGFCVDLFNNWGIGKADKNTGVLLFLSSGVRDVQIITGSGIEGVLTDAQCGEFLDDNLDYLHDNNYDEGVMHICEDMINYLMEDENRAELLLDWRPNDMVGSYTMMIYLMIGFIFLGLFGWLAYKALNGQPGDTAKKIREKSEDLQGYSGCLLFLFPIPMLFFYIYYRIARKHVKAVPLPCKKCGHQTEVLTDEQAKEYLSKGEQLEKEMNAFAFTLWRCPDCGEVEKIKEKGIFYLRYDLCPECGARVMKTTSRQYITKATYDHGGERLDLLTCACCGHEMQKTVKLLPLSRDTYSSSDSGGWFGGGRSSGGGGGRSSGGSWGGGRTSGGGAGRRF